MWYFMLTQMDLQLCIYLYHALNKLMYPYCIHEKIIKSYEGVGAEVKQSEDKSLVI